MFQRKIQLQTNEYGSRSGPDFEYEIDKRFYRLMVRAIKREPGLVKRIITKIKGNNAK